MLRTVSIFKKDISIFKEINIRLNTRILSQYGIMRGNTYWIKNWVIKYVMY